MKVIAELTTTQSLKLAESVDGKGELPDLAKFQKERHLKIALFELEIALGELFKGSEDLLPFLDLFLFLLSFSRSSSRTSGT